MDICRRRPTALPLAQYPVFYDCTMHNCKSQYPIITDSRQPCFSTWSRNQNLSLLWVHSFSHSINTEMSALASVCSSIYHEDHPPSFSAPQPNGPSLSILDKLRSFVPQRLLTRLLIQCSIRSLLAHLTFTRLLQLYTSVPSSEDKPGNPTACLRDYEVRPVIKNDDRSDG